MFEYNENKQKEAEVGPFLKIALSGQSVDSKHFRHGGCPGLVVMWGNSCSEGRGFESQHRILDWHFVACICCKCCIVCLKKTKINEKDDPFFKQNFRHISFSNIPFSNVWGAVWPDG